MTKQSSKKLIKSPKAKKSDLPPNFMKKYGFEITEK
jgi:hypothetical protein